MWCCGCTVTRTPTPSGHAVIRLTRRAGSGRSPSAPSSTGRRRPGPSSPSTPAGHWPAQTRLIELIDSGGYLSVVCTMVDHDAPIRPRSLETSDDLAALHRELAANVPYGGAGSGLSGAIADRNTELRLAPPFPLSRLTAG